MQERLTFGQALELAKQGKRIARIGWNGKDMYVFMRPIWTASDDNLKVLVSIPETVRKHLLDNCLNVVFREYLCMFAADKSIVNGWLASQTDMLATDWICLD